MRILSVVLACALTALASTGKAADLPRMDQVVQAEATDNGFMGAVLVAKGDAILLDKGYGAANLTWNIPNTPQTRFQIGSLTKQFTAAAVLLLVERGKLKLTDPVKTWWPDAPPSWDEITLSDLLTQTAGIPDYANAPDFSTMMKLKRTPQEWIATVQDKPLDFAPGTKFSYSNSSYMLLSAIAEKAAAMPYAEFERQNIFMPLGMKDTGYDDSVAVIPGIASGYSRKNGAVVNANYSDVSSRTSPEGAMYSTTHDLLIWEKALFGGKILPPASLQMMLTPARDAGGPGAPYKAGYGMGVYVGTTIDGRREVSHTGGAPGAVSMMAAYPDDKLFVIVLSNNDTAPWGDVTGKLIDLAFGKPVLLPGERKAVSLDPQILSRYIGRYQFMPDVPLAITEDGGALYAQVGKGSKFAILPQGETSFFAKKPDVQIDFQVGDGQASSLMFHAGADLFNAPRIP